MTSTRHRHLALGIALALPAAVLAGCATGRPPCRLGRRDRPRPRRARGGRSRHRGRDRHPRIALTYDGGIVVLDGTSLEQVADLPIDGFTRINPAGDERHAIVSAGDAFRVLDLGTWGEPHGTHSHFYTADPAFTTTEFAANHPGTWSATQAARSSSTTARGSSSRSTRTTSRTATRDHDVHDPSRTTASRSSSRTVTC
ncbi:hypothetical protein NKG05_16940 [Oerskovia sp. M15]